MKRKLPVLIAIVLALVIALAACQSQNQPAATGDSLPSQVGQTDPVNLPDQPANGNPVQTDATPVAPAVPTSSDVKLIAMDEAIAIALKDADLKESDVTGLHAELERDDGVTYYDVDFYKNGKEYDYEIHAQSGEILKPVKKQTSSGGTSSSSSSSAASDIITRDEAIAKALSHAGLEKSQVSRLRAELDRDDGRTVYEVDFETAQWEYEYEINAKTGAIVKAEKDRND